MITNPNLPEPAMPVQVDNTTVKTGTGEVDPDHNLISADIKPQVAMIHTEATEGHIIGIITTTTGAAHSVHAPPMEGTAINLVTTHCIDLIADHPNIEVL